MKRDLTLGLLAYHGGPGVGAMGGLTTELEDIVGAPGPVNSGEHRPLEVDEPLGPCFGPFSIQERDRELS